MQERNTQQDDMVFTLQDEQHSPDTHEQDGWEAAPHDWREPETAAAGASADPTATDAAAPEQDAHDPASVAPSLPEPDFSAFRLPEPEAAAPDQERVKPLAERTDELSADSLAARIAGLQSPEALAETRDHPDTEPPAPPERETTPEEREYGRLRYLHHLVGEHNNGLFDPDQADTAVLIQEDWLAAQDALAGEQRKEFLLPVQSHTLKNSQADVPDTPAITVHIYHLPELPIGKRVKILSETALTEGIRSRLHTHIANAVAGLTHRVLLRKTAALSYDLQMLLNEEVPQVVDDILEYHLDEIVNQIKSESEYDEWREDLAPAD
ncbi:hypothetical protein [Conchiformibius kuhniae]|uniref:Uncharacterized protein n=1 Tax=Conchiformibius kuhniae TaxID=211502 RepID=A0A8T9MVJ8_9NEIS|nr:hypothetical protein [Conchiformibius kuhniae]UOP05289.1 hypothetical protein LVJ77_03520 [Conchiformibius kuhniae]